ncbi:MAG: hypothetical protein WD425_00990 [Nitrospirales bacterium]
MIGPFLIICLAFVAYLLPSTNGWTQPVKLGNSSAEFSARLIWKHDGRKAKAQVFVKHDRYRIEHMGGVKTELGVAGVTIVRLDEQKVWYVLSQRRMVVSVPLTSDYLLPFAVTLEGETSRTLIGDSMVNNQKALLYDVEVQDRSGTTEKFFEWVDPDRHVLLKLVSQDRDWFVQYEHVVVSSQPEYYFEPPLGYRVIEAQEAPSPKS